MFTSSLYRSALIYRCLFGFSLLISEIVGLVGDFVNGGAVGFWLRWGWEKRRVFLRDFWIGGSTKFSTKFSAKFWLLI